MRMAQSTEYPLVILDRMLPDLDGMEVCRQLHRKAHRRAGADADRAMTRSPTRSAG